MKRAVILVLLPVFLYSIIGWQWMFVLRLYTHQAEEWTSSFNEDELQVITVKEDAQDHSTFLVNDNEIYHHGKHFDIKFKKRRGDEIVFYCHADTDEDEMYVSLDGQIKDEQGMSTCSNQKVLKVVKVSDYANDHNKISLEPKKICAIIFRPYKFMRSNLHGESVFVPPDAGFRIS